MLSGQDTLSQEAKIWTCVGLITESTDYFILFYFINYYYFFFLPFRPWDKPGRQCHLGMVPDPSKPCGFGSLFLPFRMYLDPLSCAWGQPDISGSPETYTHEVVLGQWPNSGCRRVI